MAKLVERIDALAGAIRDKFNQIMPRLLPPGGTAGQVLVKESNADNSVGWYDIEGGTGGVSGPISEEQLPPLNQFYGSYDEPASLTTDQYGRVSSVTRGGTKPKSKGAWTAPSLTKTYSFTDGVIPKEFDYTGTPYIYSTTDGTGANVSVLGMPTVEQDGIDAGQMRLTATVYTQTTLSFTYRLTAAQGQAVFAILRGNTPVAFDQSTTPFKTVQLVLNPGTHQISLGYQNSNVRGGDGVVFSSITLLNEGFVFGDVVSYAGANWQCLVRGTQQAPGSGSDWVRYGTDLLGGNNLWNGNNTFSGSVALNGTSTAVTPAVGTNSTAIATTEFVSSAVDTVTPRLVPLGGTAGQVLTKDSAGNATWADSAGGSGSNDPSGPSPLTFYNLGLV